MVLPENGVYPVITAIFDDSGFWFVWLIHCDWWWFDEDLACFLRDQVWITPLMISGARLQVNDKFKWSIPMEIDMWKLWPDDWRFLGLWQDTSCCQRWNRVKNRCDRCDRFDQFDHLRNSRTLDAQHWLLFEIWLWIKTWARNFVVTSWSCFTGACMTYHPLVLWAIRMPRSWWFPRNTPLCVSWKSLGKVISIGYDKQLDEKCKNPMPPAMVRCLGMVSMDYL